MSLALPRRVGYAASQFRLQGTGELGGVGVVGWLQTSEVLEREDRKFHYIIAN
jgi:hypothetical protein